MLTTIEQKLSAIQAINEEIETLERSLRTLEITRTQSALAIDSVIQFYINGKHLSLSIDKECLNKVLDIISESKNSRRTILISNAEELMK